MKIHRQHESVSTENIKRSAPVYRVDCEAAAGGCEIEIFCDASMRRCLMPGVSVSKGEFLNRRVMPIFCCFTTAPVTRAMRSTPALRARRSAPDEIWYLLWGLRQQRRHLPRSVLRLGRYRQNHVRCVYIRGLPITLNDAPARDGAWPAGAKIHARAPGEAGRSARGSCIRDMVQPLRVRRWIARRAPAGELHRYGRPDRR